MSQLAKWKALLGSTSLFARLLTGFMAVIVLLTTFFLIAFYSMNRSYYDELIGYHEESLNYTVEKYEQSFTAIQQILTNLYLNQQVQRLYSEAEAGDEDRISRLHLPSISSYLAEQVITNGDLFIEDIVLYLNNFPLTVGRTGSTSAELLFSKYLRAQGADHSFWQKQFGESYYFKLLPTTTIAPNAVTGQPRLAAIVKNKLAPNMYFIASIHSGQLLNNTYVSNQSSVFSIYNGETPIFSSAGEVPPLVQTVGAGEKGYVFQKKADQYVFYQRGSKTGLTYTATVPQWDVEAKATQLYVVFFTIVSIALLISVLVSILITVSLNNPFKRLMNGLLRNPEEPQAIYTNIKELNVIHDRLQLLSTKSKSMMSIYTFSNRLRKIKSAGSFDRNLELLDRPYLLVLLYLHYKEPIDKEPTDKEKISYYIRELVELKWSHVDLPTVTIQTESNIVISLVYTDSLETIRPSLDAICSVLEQDTSYYTVTLGVSSAGLQTADPAVSYEEAHAMTRQRRLADGPQVFTSLGPEPKHTQISPQLEHQYLQQLTAGNHQETLALVRRMVGQLQDGQAYDCHYRQLGADLVLRTKQVLRSLNIEEGTLPEKEARLPGLFTYELFLDGIESYVVTALQLVQARRSGVDPTVEFIVHYIREHYMEDISLDLMADKVKISPTYLSSYFKEKMGLNFKEYLNDIRMEHAKRLLLESNLKVQDVAEQVGYRSLTPFTRMFKLATGMSPNEYRKQLPLPEREDNRST
ncbi:helix-turn-helix domain-containing protein [Paenibacillus koleovorans]|uniref:helix-turn-helix domain-containing protein n=1 Tax=Paenibacillus koleovorans TaxID=121608 RepID=UPI000FD6CC5C|nr:helix-turn-helix domain-containing protein [Paenibacillus koleovorans]